MSSQNSSRGSPGGIYHRLYRTFFLQSAAIAIATILGIMVAGYILQEVLINEALQREAEHFWSRYDNDTEYPLPDTYNLTGYLKTPDKAPEIPPLLEPLSAGFHRELGKGYAFVYVDVYKQAKLYLVFDNEQVGQLALWFGLVPLMLVLTVLYLILWITYRFSKRAMSPIVSLANSVQALDPEKELLSELDVDLDDSVIDEEVRVLWQAMFDYTNRLRAFVERERSFTRDVSHELRTPLTVIGIASEMLESKPGIDEKTRKDVHRIRRSAADMQELVEMFLLLARETEGKIELAELEVNRLVAAEIENARVLAGDKEIDFQLTEVCTIIINAPSRALSVLLSNILSNAVKSTESGAIRTLIDEQGIHITDSGEGMDEENASRVFDLFFRGKSDGSGHGIGMSIVKRLSDRFGWQVEIDTRLGSGTTVHIDFGAGASIENRL